MTSLMGRATEGDTDAKSKSATSGVPLVLRAAALLLRALFLGTLIVLAVRVSAPQNETFWSAYDTPGDLVRLILGLAVALGILIQLFRPPRDAHAYRTWASLGLVLAPLALVVAYAVW